jgi:RNA polymerase sigma-70 factor (ECF subfamily)
VRREKSALDTQKDRELGGLFALAQDGDLQAYESCLKQLSIVLRRFLANRMRSSDLIEDVLQETLLAIHQARHTYQPDRPLGPWVYAICRHRMIDFLRKHRRVSRREEPLPNEFDFPDPATLKRFEPQMEARLTEALKELPQQQRNVIECLKWQDLSVKETAQRLGLSESTVKISAFRGYQTIRRMLEVSRP